MGFDSAIVDDQEIGDLAVGFALGKQGSYLALAPGQAAELLGFELARQSSRQAMQ